MLTRGFHGVVPGNVAVGPTELCVSQTTKETKTNLLSTAKVWVERVDHRLSGHLKEPS